MFADAVESIDDPASENLSGLDWRATTIPSTVAAAQRDAGGVLDADDDLGARDHWYRCRFAAPDAAGDIRLQLGGLATLADVWLNGEHLLHSENMFVAHDLPIAAGLQPNNELLIRFHALSPALGKRRPRPRWRTALVSSQTLRWFRTTLLGHLPSWCPNVIAVGPWRDIELIVVSGPRVRTRTVRTTVDGDAGCVAIDLEIDATTAIEQATLHVGEQTIEVSVEASDSGWRVHGSARIEAVGLWWPHTHGDQPLYPARVELKTAGRTVNVKLGQLGFRVIAPTTVDSPGLVINDVEVYCRGACWTTLDLARLAGDADAYREALQTARDGGMNMLRIGGTMVYEHADFYRLCDELGILVWQDFMFANMDYPFDDPDFASSVANEVQQFLNRTQTNCSLAVLCGSSEVEQQAAMLGLPRDAWSNDWFTQGLPELCREARPDLPYWPSSPTGGDLPFHIGTGIAHYYGVGAYQRPIEDARLHPPRFTAECLAFANVPEPETLAKMANGAFLAPHHPAYKERVPRDAGAGWDFADVTDHYVERLFGLDTRELRYADCARYYQLCRVGIGEVLKTVAGAWRAADNHNQGALIWFLRDLANGAGWGLLDADSRPKSVWYYLRRAWLPRATWLVDEGLDGLRVHVANDRPDRLKATIRVSVLGAMDAVVASAEAEVDVVPHGQQSFGVDRLLARFADTTYAYRFGPRTHGVVMVQLIGADGALLSDDCYFPERLPNQTDPAVELRADVEDLGVDGGTQRYRVTFRSDRFCQAIAIEAPGFLPSDNYFHLAPGAEKSVELRGEPSTRGLRGYAQPLNSTHSIRLVGP